MLFFQYFARQELRGAIALFGDLLLMIGAIAIE